MSGKKPPKGAQSVDPDAIKLAQRKFSQIIHANRTQAKQLQEVVEELEGSMRTLKGLTEKLTAPSMVPIGTVAFMPGYLEHTNEVTVLLGDNWFSQMTSKQAIEVLLRRQTMIKANLAKVEEEYRLIKSRIGLTPDLLDGGDDITEGVFEREDGFFEIRESLDDDEDTEVESTQPLKLPEKPLSKRPLIEVIDKTPTTKEEPALKEANPHVAPAAAKKQSSLISVVERPSAPSVVGAIKEAAPTRSGKDVVALTMPTVSNAEPASSITVTEEPKRVSRFKASRSGGI